MEFSKKKKTWHHLTPSRQSSKSKVKSDNHVNVRAETIELQKRNIEEYRFWYQVKPEFLKQDSKNKS